MNQTKYLVPLLLTFNNQEKSIYVPKSIGNFIPLMLPLAVWDNLWESRGGSMVNGVPREFPESTQCTP